MVYIVVIVETLELVVVTDECVLVVFVHDV